ncbi:hypothetical protein MESS2_80123 [Mesorhizobium metallidurans STM 2683]|uniref:Uncharacterized protein n=1 Tax=Mesorhizobium metallidurans STM 2683 TaxID=1297569 RepID=M5EXR8_9HYPH|nr:hypothetical protein MESS2_80123 [Mesorhizobium metallidurans STM 2683]
MTLQTGNTLVKRCAEFLGSPNS